MSAQRQLAAIMFTDIVGYTALMGSDEENALALLRVNREIHKVAIEKYNGQWLKEIGDAVLAQFSSAVLAVQCAREIQFNAQDLGAKIRIGIHLGDVTFENNDVFGDGVNIAARMQSIADPGGIYITDSVYQAIRSQAQIHCRYIGNVKLKNVNHPVGTYSIIESFLPVPDAGKMKMLVNSRSRRKTNSSLLIIALVVSSVLLGIVAVFWWRSSQGVADIRSLVVLPVENRTGDPGVDIYTDGIHDAIINEIGKISALRVPSTRTALSYRDSELTIPEIASELNVAAVLEASLFQIGDSIKIRVNLIAAVPEERQIWSQEFIRDLPHILSVYGDMVSGIARELDLALSDDQIFKLTSNRVVVPQAYEAYIKGMSHWYKLTRNDLDQALRYFELAIKIDPSYAPAYTGVAMVWGGRAQQGIVPGSDVGQRVDSLMSKALALDSSLMEVHYTIALTSTWWKWNWDRAGYSFRKAIVLNPNHAGVRIYYSHYLNIIGKPTEAIQQMQRALELDPVNPLFRALGGMDLNYARRFEEAITLLKEVLEDAPNDPVALSALRAAYHNKKDFDNAYNTFVRSYEVSGDQESIKALKQGYAQGGYKTALTHLAEFLIKRSSIRYVTPFRIGTLYARAGISNKAVHYLSLAYDEHDPNMPYIAIDPIFDDLKEHPQYQELVDKMNFPK